MDFQSLVKLLAYRAAESKERIFLSWPEEQLDVTYSEFYEAAQQLAQYLQVQGLKQGERVALSLENGVHWILAFWGIILAGGVVVPLNPKFKVAEWVPLLEQAESSWMIAENQGAGLLSEHGVNPVATAYSSPWNQAELVVSTAQRQRRKALTKDDAEFSDEALLLFTSGSTGRPKGVVLTHGNLLAEAAFIQQGHALTQGDIGLAILPFFHINGLVITMLTPLFSGGRAIVPEKFRASKFWEWVKKYQVTWFSGVPTILSILLARKDPEPLDTTSLRFARSASSSLSVAVLEEFEQRFHVPVIEAYGLSETGSQVATNPLPPSIRKTGSVGLPVGNELRIVDEQGRPVPNGIRGEVVIQGKNVTQGYLNNKEANQESFKQGWFYTGDIGFFDEDGYLFLAGRRKELINRAGEKISPREVDEVIYQLPEVLLAAAVGVPDPLFGEEIVAFIQLRPGEMVSEEQVIRHCKACLANFKVPKRIFYLDDFPKGPNGKIQRLKLVALYHKGVVNQYGL